MRILRARTISAHPGNQGGSVFMMSGGGATQSGSQREQFRITHLLSAVAAVAANDVVLDDRAAVIAEAAGRPHRLDQAALRTFLDHLVRQNSVLEVRQWLLAYLDELSSGGGGAIGGGLFEQPWTSRKPQGASSSHQGGDRAEGGYLSVKSSAGRPTLTGGRSSLSLPMPLVSTGRRSHSPLASPPVASGLATRSTMSQGSVAHQRHVVVGGRSVSKGSYESSREATVVPGAGIASVPSSPLAKWTASVGKACRQLHTLSSPMRLRLECLHDVTQAAVEGRVELVRFAGVTGSAVVVAAARLLPLMTYQLTSGGDKHLTRQLLSCTSAIADVFAGVMFARLGHGRVRGLLMIITQLASGMDYSPGSSGILLELRHMLKSLIFRMKGEETCAVEVLYSFLRSAKAALKKKRTTGKKGAAAEEEDEEDNVHDEFRTDDEEVAKGLDLTRFLLLQQLYQLVVTPGTRHASCDGGWSEEGGQQQLACPLVHQDLGVKRFAYAIDRTVSHLTFAVPIMSKTQLLEIISRNDDDDGEEDDVLIRQLREAVGHLHQVSPPDSKTSPAISIIHAGEDGASHHHNRKGPHEQQHDSNFLVASEYIRRWVAAVFGGHHYPHRSEAAADGQRCENSNRGVEECQVTAASGASACTDGSGRVQSVCSVSLSQLKPLHDLGAEEDQEEAPPNQAARRLSTEKEAQDDVVDDDDEVGKEFFRLVVQPLLARLAVHHHQEQDEHSVGGAGDNELLDGLQAAEVAAIFAFWFPRTVFRQLQLESSSPSGYHDRQLLSRAVDELLLWSERGHNSKSMRPALLHDGWRAVLFLPLVASVAANREGKDAAMGNEEKEALLVQRQWKAAVLVTISSGAGRQKDHHHHNYLGPHAAAAPSTAPSGGVGVRSIRTGNSRR